MKTLRSTINIIKPSDARILIAEDHPVNKFFLLKVLQSIGFENIDSVENGLEALLQVGKHNYDLIFMDCQMPEMDGYDATRAIRKYETSYHSLIIAMTASAMVGDREIYINAGMDEYISKPIELDALKTLLSKWFVIQLEKSADQKTNFILDLNRLRIASSSAEEELELLKLFFDTAASKLTIMQNCVSTNDQKKWKAAAHYLKGSSANLGIESLTKICRNAELAKDPYAELLKEIKTEIANSKKAIIQMGYDL